MTDSSKGAAGGLGSALILILLLTGVAIWQWPLESLRPASRGTPVDRIAGLQDIPARLWQDPFVATRDSAKPKDDSAKPRDKAAEAGADKAAARLRRPNGVGEVIDEYRKAHGKSAFEVELLAVMVNGGRSADDAENRLRTRYAVVSGILASEYAPDDPENLGLAVVPIPQPASPSQTTFSLPFEWYTCSPRGDQETLYRARRGVAPIAGAQAQPGCKSAGKRLLVLWLNNTVLDQTGKPLANLLQLFPRGAAGVTVIGPTNSDTLSGYVDEAREYAAALGGEARTLKGLRILSPSATVADEVLLKGWKPRKGGKADVATFFAETIGLDFVRTVGPDERLVETLVGELRLRGLSPPLCFDMDWRCDSPNTVLLIYEADSLYARSLVDKFAQTMLAACDALQGVSFEKCVNLESDRLLSFDYLRGLDGDSGARDSDAQAKKEESASSGGEPGRAAASAKERPHGPSQYDYLRRMSRSILDIQASLLSQYEKRDEEKEEAKKQTRGSALKPRAARLGSLMTPRIRAVGVIGSDTFDKLLILQAVKPLLPEATFFTVDLDARFLEADQYAWTRNLVIASNFGLELDPDIQKETAPFRDTYQSGAFLATRLALGCPKLAMPPQLLDRPRVYEVGRGEAVDLSPFALERDIPDTGCALIDADKAEGRTPSLHRERADRAVYHLGVGTLVKALFVCGLGFALFWAFFSTSRDTAAWKDFVGFAVAFGVGTGVYEMFYRLIVSNEAEEPWRFLSGVSIWPTHVVLLLTVVYCVWSGLRVRDRIRESNARIGSLFFDSASITGSFAAAPRRTRGQAIMDWGWRMARPTWKRSVGAARGNGALWDEYLRHGSLSGSLWRALIASTVFLIVWMVLSLTQPPIVPVRGWLSYHFEYFVSKGALLALMWLVFFVADQVRVCLGFFRYFAESRADGHGEWSSKILKRFGQSAAAAGDERHLLSDYVDIRLFAERSKVIGETVYYPFIALVLFVAARVEFFDAWTWPLALGLMVGACFLLLVLAFVMLRRAAAKARERAIRRLAGKYLELIGAGEGKKQLAAQVQDTLEQVKSIAEGAFRPLSEEPVMRALIIPTGGLSGLGALQYFFVQRF